MFVRKISKIAAIGMICSLPMFALAAPESIPSVSKNQVITTQSVSLAQAKVMVAAAEQKAKEIGVPMVIAVVDPHGNLILHERMEDALLVSIDLSIKKAYSAVALKMSSEQLGRVTAPGKELYGIQHSDERLVTFGGGFPIIVNGKIVGAIGVSGGSVAEDMSVAKAGLAVVK